MAVQSMTGFSRTEGQADGTRWAWELRSVNGKGLDIRTRLPQGTERYEPEVRRLCQEAFQRGNIQVSLSLDRLDAEAVPTLNEAAFEAALAAAERIGARLGGSRPSVDAILAVRGVLELREREPEAEALAEQDRQSLAGLERAVAALETAREAEGAALVGVLSRQLDAIEAELARVETDPSRSSGSIRARLSREVTILMENADGLDGERLYAEAALLATKADLREEIDRLEGHIASARTLLANEDAVGRRLNFLAQEFNREANTICSKSNASAVTAAGLEMKVVIDQFREQIQNLE
ncbi:YicC/YloC family endoribonuclease [Pararhizobium mangrovi]|uniref:YicC family protein n=1 Tax=Pararhizobium mangrovi TaxID=2590452 RepID=A0A506UC88_9HYPH|nr:YicC/YloC family endoribonuclease [Pararhizobium mangrovi]TPW32043.1 YicC family protein [Pararhizobium mangrovi]